MTRFGRCYCGQHRLVATAPPLTVVHCHCSDCRRVTGGAIATFAAFDAASVQVTPEVAPTSHAKGVARRFCPSCGSAFTATYDYLPGQIFVPLGIFDELDDLVPERHCHAQSMAAWMTSNDGLPRHGGSGRDALSSSAKRPT